MRNDFVQEFLVLKQKYPWQRAQDVLLRETIVNVSCVCTKFRFVLRFSTERPSGNLSIQVWLQVST